MELHVNLSDHDIAIPDAFVRNAQPPFRATELRRAVQLLRFPDLEDHYAQAWHEWTTAEEHEAWDGTAADGTAEATRSDVASGPGSGDRERGEQTQAGGGRQQ